MIILKEIELITGTEAIIRSLEKEGVKTIFGIPGGAVLPLYDELYDSDIQQILTKHEQAAAHAADGYARATGKVGVCIATSGPGATNLVTGIANAYMDSSSIVALTGQVPRNMIGNDAFQEADITGITIPITKHNYLVKTAEEIPRIIKEAFYIASTGRKGPVLIDLPKDVTTEMLEYNPPKKVELPGYKPTIRGHPKQIHRASELIATAERPVIFAGGGVISSGAHNEVVTLAELIPAPVVMTLMGLGTIPANHPLTLGMIGMHGTKYANYAVTECDLLISIGVRFDDRATGKLESFAPNAKIIHIDIDPAEIGKNVRVDVPIVGDAKVVLKDLIKLVKSKARKEWEDKIQRWKREYKLTYEKSTSTLKPQYIIEKTSEIAPDAVITTEVGQNQMWVAQYFKFKYPRQLITSGGLGTMGFGFPAAIGAKVGVPDKTVIDFAGDGSFLMNIQELATAVDFEIGVKVFILNNQFLGMVRQWQELFFNKRYSNVCLRCKGMEFARIAEAFGGTGFEVTKPSEVEETIKEALKIDDGPVVVDFKIAREENVFPMVPAGAAINEMLG